MLSVKHVVNILKVIMDSMYSIYFESQTDSWSHLKGCALLSLDCIIHCTTQQRHPGYGVAFIFLFLLLYFINWNQRDERDEVVCENSRNHSYLEISNMQSLPMQVSLKYFLKMYELIKQAKSDSSCKFKRVSEKGTDHSCGHAKRLTYKED